MAASIVLVKDDGRWFLDLDENARTEPRDGRGQLMGPMLAKQMKPMKDTAAKIARTSRRATTTAAAEAMAAFQDAIMRRPRKRWRRATRVAAEEWFAGGRLRPRPVAGRRRTR